MKDDSLKRRLRRLEAKRAPSPCVLNPAPTPEQAEAWYRLPREEQARELERDRAAYELARKRGLVTLKPASLGALQGGGS